MPRESYAMHPNEVVLRVLRWREAKSMKPDPDRELWVVEFYPEGEHSPRRTRQRTVAQHNAMIEGLTMACAIADELASQKSDSEWRES